MDVGTGTGSRDNPNASTVCTVARLRPLLASQHIPVIRTTPTLRQHAFRVDEVRPRADQQNVDLCKLIRCAAQSSTRRGLSKSIRSFDAPPPSDHRLTRGRPQSFTLRDRGRTMVYHTQVGTKWYAPIIRPG